jgi:hypothetical protein
MYPPGRLSSGITRQTWMDAGHGDDTPSAAPSGRHVQCSQHPWPLGRKKENIQIQPAEFYSQFCLEDLYVLAVRYTACLMKPLSQKFACKKLRNQRLNDDARQV